MEAMSEVADMTQKQLEEVCYWCVWSVHFFVSRGFVRL